MVGSHVAWVFVALLLGVCIGWITYKRARARLVDPLVWIAIGLLLAAPVWLPNLAAVATPLGTLVALFYFIGCPLGWTWRHSAVVEHKCAETDAKGYVYRGMTPPPRWQALSHRRETSPPRSVGLATTTRADAVSVPPAIATAHAVPSDGKDVAPSISSPSISSPSISSQSVAGTTGATAGVTTAPNSPVTGSAGGQAPLPATAAPDGVSADGSSAQGATSTHSIAPSAASTAEFIDPASTGSPAPIATDCAPTPVAASSTPIRTDAPTPPSTSTPASDTPQASAVVTEDHVVQASFGFASPPTADAAGGKAEPQTASPAPPAASDPPASAPVPDQHKHAGVRPPGFVTPREDRPDDLQLIRGIGPQNEGRLYGLGIWHFDQIGAWTADEVRWVGSYLAFPGRIDREKWVEQARDIAAGAIIPKAAARRPARPR